MLRPERNEDRLPRLQVCTSILRVARSADVALVPMLKVRCVMHCDGVGGAFYCVIWWVSGIVLFSQPRATERDEHLAATAGGSATCPAEVDKLLIPSNLPLSLFHTPTPSSPPPPLQAMVDKVMGIRQQQQAAVQRVQQTQISSRQQCSVCSRTSQARCCMGRSFCSLRRCCSWLLLQAPVKKQQ
ncbi:unnamed protein product [Closterium sp. NIES-54]